MPAARGGHAASSACARRGSCGRHGSGASSAKDRGRRRVVAAAARQVADCAKHVPALHKRLGSVQRRGQLLHSTEARIRVKGIGYKV